MNNASNLLSKNINNNPNETPIGLQISKKFNLNGPNLTTKIIKNYLQKNFNEQRGKFLLQTIIYYSNLKYF